MIELNHFPLQFKFAYLESDTRIYVSFNKRPTLSSFDRAFDNKKFIIESPKEGI